MMIQFFHVADEPLQVYGIHYNQCMSKNGTAQKIVLPGKQVAVNFHQLETPKTSNPVA